MGLPPPGAMAEASASAQWASFSDDEDQAAGDSASHAICTVPKARAVPNAGRQTLALTCQLCSEKSNMAPSRE